MIEIFKPQTDDQRKILDDLARMFQRQYNARLSRNNPILKSVLDVSTGEDLLDKGDNLLRTALLESTGELFDTHALRLILLAREAGIPREEIIALALHYFYPFTLFGKLPMLYENHRISDEDYNYVRARLGI